MPSPALGITTRYSALDDESLPLPPHEGTHLDARAVRGTRATMTAPATALMTMANPEMMPVAAMMAKMTMITKSIMINSGRADRVRHYNGG